jgi:hypothetical protein
MTSEAPPAAKPQVTEPQAAEPGSAGLRPVTLKWPYSGNLIPAGLVGTAQRYLDRKRTGPGQRGPAVRLALPLEAAACAALLHAADTIVTALDLREALAPLIDALATGACRVPRSPGCGLERICPDADHAPPPKPARCPAPAAAAGPTAVA